ncbi:MAG: peptidylprolyl isomerase [Bacteroidaceae bacterium]|nr:peptidylprolyl isomerase [Bacteroidaceae bacterium]
MNIKVNFIKGLLCAMLAVFPLQSMMAQDNVIDRVEWVVGDKFILRSDIEEAIRYWVSNGRTFEGDPYCVVGEDLAVQQLFLHQAAIDSIEVDESNVIRQVEAQMEHVIRQIGSKEKMEEYFNMTSADIREMYREQLHNMEMAERMKMKIVGDIKVSPVLVRRYFESLPKDSVPFIPQQVEVQIITMHPHIDQEEIERVKAELREYTERIMNGETSFSTMALMYSQDPGSARRGGELGFSGRGQFQPEFSAVAFNLTDPGKVSKIVETEYGFHIIQLIEKRGDKVNVRHILRKPEHSNENLKAALLRLDSLAVGIKEGEIKFDDAVGLYSEDKDTRNNFGIMYNKQNASSHFAMDELPVDVARVIETLAVDEISQPFAWLLDNGKTVCAIAKVKSRTEAHQATFSDDYEVLRQMYQAKLSDERIKEWIKKKQRDTYVRVNKESRSCEFIYPDWNFYEE